MCFLPGETEIPEQRSVYYAVFYFTVEQSAYYSEGHKYMLADSNAIKTKFS